MKFAILSAIGVLSLFLYINDSHAQFKDQTEGTPRVAGSIIRSGSSPSLFSFINPDNFRMQHSYSMSYMSAGGRGLALGMFTSSFGYQISNPLSVEMDVSLMHSPFNNFGHGSDMSGVYISRAGLHYQPSNYFSIQVQYQQIPYQQYRPSFYQSGFRPFVY